MTQQRKNAYQIIKHQHVTEKAGVLQQLESADSNLSVRRCNKPKYVFVVDKLANKHQIAQAIEEIYSERNLKVVSVNTINVKGKPRRVRGFRGKTAGFKKAIVTLAPGDSLEDI